MKSVKQGSDKWVAALMAGLLAASLASAQALAAEGAAGDASMSFFVTSHNPGKGGDFGGVKGADAHCQSLAESAGVGDRQWAAYLSTSEENARDRIGAGPWYNAEGVMVAKDVEALHSVATNVSQATALTEKGEHITGYGDTPNRHDILTASNAQGELEGGTCQDWTSSSNDEGVMVGHFDRQGGGAQPTSWNSAHQTKGCDIPALKSTGGDGLLYCFAK